MDNDFVVTTMACRFSVVINLGRSVLYQRPCDIGYVVGNGQSLRYSMVQKAFCGITGGTQNLSTPKLRRGQ